MRGAALVAGVLSAGCMAAPLGGFDGEEALPPLGAAEASYAPRTAAGFLPAYGRELMGSVDLGLQIVFPGSEQIDADDSTSPQYNELWSTSIGLAAYYRGAITPEVHYYGGLTLAFLMSKTFDFFGIDMCFSDELMMTLGGGVQYRTRMEGLAPYGRLGLGILFWPETEFQTDLGDVDYYEKSTGLFVEVGGGLSFAARTGKMFLDVGYMFGPAPELESGFSFDTGKYNPFTITIGGSFGF